MSEQESRLPSPKKPRRPSNPEGGPRLGCGVLIFALVVALEICKFIRPTHVSAVSHETPRPNFNLPNQSDLRHQHNQPITVEGYPLFARRDGSSRVLALYPTEKIGSKMLILVDRYDHHQLPVFTPFGDEMIADAFRIQGIVRQDGNGGNFFVVISSVEKISP